MSSLAQILNGDYVSERECRIMRHMDAEGATRGDIRLETGRQYRTIARHVSGECDHRGGLNE